MKFAGTLGRRDAQLWKHYWTIRGHQVRLDPNGRGQFYCYLKLEAL